MDLATLLREHAKWVDTAGVDGEQADLSSGQLQAEVLPVALLRELYAPNSDWRGADLRRTDLRSATLVGAVLSATGAVTTMHDAIFQQALTTRGSFVSALANRCNFIDAVVNYTDFKSANLTNSDFSGANLTGASFLSADLTGVRLTNAVLERANLTSATVTGLRGAQVFNIGNKDRRLTAVWHTSSGGRWMIAAVNRWHTKTEALAHWALEQPDITKRVRDEFTEAINSLPVTPASI